MQLNIATKHFEADGAAVNLILGFVPNFVLAVNTAAAAGEVMAVLWFGSEMGDGKEIQFTRIADNGSTANTNISYASSGGYISAYNTKSVDSGTVDSDDDPVRVTGGQGITIGADFTDDSDEVFVLALGSPINTDEGDINA